MNYYDIISVLIDYLEYIAYVVVIINFFILSKMKNKFNDQFWAKASIYSHSIYSIVCIKLFTDKCVCGYPFMNIPSEIICWGLWIFSYILLYKFMKKDDFSKKQFFNIFGFMVGLIVLSIGLRYIFPGKHNDIIAS